MRRRPKPTSHIRAKHRERLGNGVECIIENTVLEVHDKTGRLGLAAGDGFPVRRRVVWEWTYAGTQIWQAGRRLSCKENTDG